MKDYKTYKTIAKNLGFKIQYQPEDDIHKDALLISKNNKNCLFFLSEFTETEFAHTIQKI